MKVLMLNTYDDVGGADRAARRLQSGLRGAGVETDLLVHLRYGDGKDISCSGSPLQKMLRRLKLFLGTLPVRLYPRHPVNNFTPALLPDRLAARVAGVAADLIHLHWLGAGFCRIETLAAFKGPLVWTLHDSWPFTGGCHVPGSCQNYRERCGACPILGSGRGQDLSRWTWNRKKRGWRELPLTLVAPSRWLADCARASSLFRDVRVEVIPNGLDTGTFRPLDRRVARQQLGLPQERPLVLFGAVNPLTDPNKGWHLLREALKIAAKTMPHASVAVFGATAPPAMENLGLPVVFLGRLHNDASLVAAYSAADVCVVPSVQETFCQTATEAMACGTPVVAFGATGLLDVIDHEGCGYLARPYEIADLARGIVWVIENRARHAKLSIEARRKAKAEFGIDAVSERYLTLYRELLASTL